MMPSMLTIRVLALAAQEIGVARRHHDPTVLMAVDDGTTLEDPGFAGADLLVARAEVLQTRAMPAHAPAATSTTEPDAEPDTGNGTSTDTSAIEEGAA